MIKAPTRDQQEQLAALDAQLADGRAATRRPRAGDRGGTGRMGATSTPAEPRLAIRRTARRFAARRRLRPIAERCRPIQDGDPASPRAGRSGRRVRRHALVDAGDVGGFGFYDQFTLAAWIQPDGRDGRHDPLADDRRAAGRGLQRRSSTAARSRSTWSSAGSTTPSGSRPTAAVAAGRWHARRGHLRRLAGRRRACRSTSTAGRQPIDGAARRAEPDVPDQGAAPDRRRRRARGPVPRARSTTSAIYDDVLGPRTIAVLATPESIADDRRDARRQPDARPGARSSAPCFLETGAARAIRQAWQQVVALRGASATR